jgi:hypothetical protein
LASIEDAVTEALRDGIDPSSVGSFDEKLNEMQIVLESLASSTYFSGTQLSN